MKKNSSKRLVIDLRAITRTTTTKRGVIWHNNC